MLVHPIVNHGGLQRLRTDTSQSRKTYDFASIERVQSGGKRFEDQLNFEPLSLPEYITWYTQKSPPHLRYLMSNFSH